jgi:hypothetical protein
MFARILNSLARRYGKRYFVDVPPTYCCHSLLSGFQWEGWRHSGREIRAESFM